MPLNFDTSRGPVHVLIYMEHAERHGGLDPVDQRRYNELVEVLHTMSDSDQGRITEGLLTLAMTMNSPGAARALRGLRLRDYRRKIVELIAIYPKDPEVDKQTADERRRCGPRAPHPSYNLPLVLSETSDPAEVKLLAKCSRFKRPDGSRTPDDILFCTNAIEALATVQSPLAQEALLAALASDNQALSDAARAALLRNCSDQTRAVFRELLALPKSEAIRRIARIEGKGGVGALAASFFRSSSYDRFFDAAKTIAGR